MKTMKAWAAAAGLMSLMASVQAVPVFQGRLADGTASNTCTVSGAGKCTSFYFATLDITVLNDWNIGRGIWSAVAAAGSAQAVAASAGLAATGLDGWMLPTGHGDQPEGPLNQYLSLWLAVGSSLGGLGAQFDRVQADVYWSGTAFSEGENAWGFYSVSSSQVHYAQAAGFSAVAVRPGDVAAAVPEPQTWAMLLMGFGAVAVASKRRRFRPAGLSSAQGAPA